MALSELKAQFVAIFVEAVLYGVYSVLVVITTTLLLRHRSAGDSLRRPVVPFTLLMYLLSMTHMVLVLTGGMPLFIGANGESATAIRQPPPTLSAAQGIIEVVSCLFADGILLWRVWVVWGKKYWVMVLPMCTLAGSIVSGILYADAPSLLPGQTATGLTKFGPPAVVLTLLTNIICTVLIAGRIWYIQRRLSNGLGTSSNQSSKRTNSAILLVLESGAIYSTAWIAIILLFLTNSFASGIVLGMIAQLTGIIPTVIILLAHLNLIMGDSVEVQKKHISAA